MIIKENAECLYCIEQHNHAMISGQFINQWQDDYFSGLKLKPSVEYAVTNHDRSWVPLDRKPLYLEEENTLASFINYPLKEKIQAYRTGIEQMLQEDIYAGFLISCHYASFFDGAEEYEGSKFLKEERERQKYLKQNYLLQFKDLSEAEEQFHFDLLQLCDNLSLYLCMNNWGTPKEKEVSWFKDGFPQKLKTLNGERFNAFWRSETEVVLKPFPFKTERLHVSIPYKEINRADLSTGTVRELYKDSPYKYHPVSIVRE